MKPKDAKKEFEKFIKQSGQSLELLTSQTALSLMLDFYKSVRAEDCPLDEDGDMLLYQWGMYDDKGGKSFHYDLTRQFILADSGGDEGMSQLSLTLYFKATPELKAIKDGNEWCYSPDDLTKFRAFIEKSPAYRATAALKPTNATVRYSRI